MGNLYHETYQSRTAFIPNTLYMKVFYVLSIIAFATLRAAQNIIMAIPSAVMAAYHLIKNINEIDSIIEEVQAQEIDIDSIDEEDRKKLEELLTSITEKYKNGN